MLGKKLDKPRRKYDDEFKADVLKMAFSGRPIQEIATSLGINANMIRRWRVEQAGVQEVSSPTVPVVIPAVPGAEHERIKARLREVEQERDILKKALGIFSRGI